MGKRKPNGYWTYERCKEEALKYNNLYDFRNDNNGAYRKSNRMGWSYDIFNHFIDYRKPNGYWTYDKCKEVALLCNNRSEFQEKHKGAYSVSQKNKWLDNIYNHMIELKKTPNYWTYDKCKEVALLCNNRSEYSKKYNSAYRKSLKNNWLDSICKHMKPKGNRKKRCIYAYEFSDNYVYIGLTYNIDNRHNRHINDDRSSVYNHHKNHNISIPYPKKLTDYLDIDTATKLEKEWVNKYENIGWKILNKTKTGSLGGNTIKWTYEKCKEVALLCDTKSEFMTKYPSAYNSVRKNKWLDDICSHMKIIKKPTFIVNYNNCKKLSLLCNNKTDFHNNYRAAYNYSKINNWLNEFFPKN